MNFLQNTVHINLLQLKVEQMLKILRLSKCFSTAVIPTVDISDFLMESGNYTKDCRKIADSLRDYGCIVINDPRVKSEHNGRFINMMEHFFSNRAQMMEKKIPITDIYEQLSFQIGATPENTERARDNTAFAGSLLEEHRPKTPFPPPFDAKWRYLWNMGDPSEGNPANRPPTDIPDFKQTMQIWGNHMLNTCFTVAQMSAIGLGLNRQIFVQHMKRAPHKLAPTGSNLLKHEVGTVLAGLHYDYNFLTIHGKSRFPGLFIWLRNGQKLQVKIAEGQLLLQAGKQFQYMTGGHITSGFHQVIYTKEAAQLKDKAIKQGRIPWRISSTLFATLRGDVTLQPLKKFAKKQILEKYPPILTREHQSMQLQAISLKKE